MQQKLFMVLIGCRPKGRSTEQHDVFFGIAPTLRELVPAMIAFWPEAKGKIHVDAWREVNYVNGYKVTIADKPQATADGKLFFINLGGYKLGEFEEFHYKMVVAAPDMSTAIKASKHTAFYKHTGFKGATSHIDDKHGVDVDDIFIVDDLLVAENKWFINVEPGSPEPDDPLQLGYFKLDKL